MEAIKTLASWAKGHDSFPASNRRVGVGPRIEWKRSSWIWNVFESLVMVCRLCWRYGTG